MFAEEDNYRAFSLIMLGCSVIHATVTDIRGDGPNIDFWGGSQSLHGRLISLIKKWQVDCRIDTQHECKRLKPPLSGEHVASPAQRGELCTLLGTLTA